MKPVVAARFGSKSTGLCFAFIASVVVLAGPTDAFAISARCQQFAARTAIVQNAPLPAINTLSSTVSNLDPGEILTFYLTDANPNNSLRVTTSSQPSNTSAFTNVRYESNTGTQAYPQTVAPGDTDVNMTLNQLDAAALITIEIICVAPAAVAPNTPTASDILEQTRQTYSKIAAQTSSQVLGDVTAGAIGDAFSGGGTTQIGQGAFSTNFAAIERAQDAAAAALNDSSNSDPFAALAYAKSRMSSPRPMFKKAPSPVLRSPWHVWIDGRFTGFEDRRATSFDGWQNHFTAGASYMFTNNFLAGVLVGYENFKYSVVAAGIPASLNGNGITGGGYFGWKFYDRLRFDGLLTYGRIDYGAAAGAVTGAFGADRISGMGKLSGRYGMGTFFVEPSATLTVASERQDSFVDTAAVLHNKFNFTVGRASTGGTIGTPIAWGLCVVTPTFGAFADYRFGDETVAAANVIPTLSNGWSAHVNGGLSVAMPNNLTASATGEYGGLGNPIQYWRAKGSLGVKF